eukprot:3777607-Rhodomonas_salina.1
MHQLAAQVRAASLGPCVGRLPLQRRRAESAAYNVCLYLHCCAAWGGESEAFGGGAGGAGRSGAAGGTPAGTQPAGAAAAARAADDAPS